jgi:hypothetical protein
MNEIFDKCVDILIFLGNITGLTYKEINVLIFCIIWPLLTIFFFGRLFFLKNS